MEKNKFSWGTGRHGFINILRKEDLMEMAEGVIDSCLEDLDSGKVEINKTDDEMVFLGITISIKPDNPFNT